MATKDITGSLTSTVFLESYPGFTSFDITGTVNVAGNIGVYGDLSQAWTVTNSGLIIGTTGLFFQSGGTAGTVGNSGTITASATNGAGILLLSGGSVGNQGLVQGAGNGIWIQGGSGTVSNSGTIRGTSGGAVVLLSGGTVANTGTISDSATGGVYLKGASAMNGSLAVATALITGSIYGIISSAAGGTSNIVNYGTITASGTNSTGVLLQSGGSVGNHGLIEGAANGVWIQGGSGTVSNSGQIRGAGNGVVLKSGGTIENSGTITSSTGNGVYLTAGLVTNGQSGSTTALISGYSGLVAAATTATSSVVNYGTIAASGTNESGVLLQSGGSVENHGLITGAANGVWVSGASGTVINLGTIDGTANDGVVLKSGGTIDNSGIITSSTGDGVYLTAGLVTNGQSGSTTALISGYSGLVAAATAATSSVVNFGTIAASGTNESGVLLQSGGSVENHGLITGAANGVWVSGASGTVTNLGTIDGTAHDGVVLKAGGSVYNGQSDAITGANAGVWGDTASAIGVVNYGTIAASASGSTGLDLRAGGSVSNHGLIEGAQNGIFLAGAAATVNNAGTISGVYGVAVGPGDTANNTVINSGTIIGTNRYAVFFGNGNNLLVISPQAVFTGNVYGGTGSNRIELAAGTATGTLDLGTKFIGFNQLTVDSGAVWQVDEASAKALTLTNEGTILVPKDGLLALASDSAGTGGTIELASGGTVDEEGPVGAAQTVDFLAATGTLLLDAPASFGGTISGFQAGDELDLVNTTATSLVYSGSSSAGTLTVMNGLTPIATLALAGGTNYSQSAFALSSPGGGVSKITMNGGSASGLLFNLSYDSSVASALTGFLADLSQAVYFLEQHFVDPITINLEVGWGEISGTTLPANIDEGGPSRGTTYTYSQVKTALTNDAKSSADATSLANLPSSDPTGGGAFYIGGAEQKALGLIAGNSAGIDGAIGMQIDPTQSYSFGALEHEITHALGRIALLGQPGNSSDYSVLDLFRYTASGLSPTATTGAYFSIDGGNTSINTFSDGSGLPADAVDFGDWAGATQDAFNNGSSGPVSTGDLTEMDVLGFDSACYCVGTMIATEAGEVPIEELAIGDRVVTLSGGVEPIRWIGRRGYDGRFIAGNRQALPICVTAGALADGVPARDLWLSPEHSLYLDGALVQAKHIVNGATIVQADSVDQVAYFHIELDTHDIIFADGAPAETFVDCDNRMMFANGAEYALLYPDDERPTWEFCVPRLEWDSEPLTDLRAALLERAEMLGHSLDADPDFRLLIDGEIVRPASVLGSVYRFDIAAGSRELLLASRSTVPAEIDATARDIRRLGVPLERIMLSDGEMALEVWHGHAALRDGFHRDEGSHRWTDGLARLPETWLRPFAGDFTLEVHLGPSGLGYRGDPPASIHAAA